MKVHELFAQPQNWCQGNLAETAEGRSCPPNDTAACRWCLTGAVLHCYETTAEQNQAFDRLFRVLAQRYALIAALPYLCVLQSFNDAMATTHDKILTMAREAAI